MENRAGDALHQVRTGIEDVLSGYETLEERAEAEILPVVRKLNEMHLRHSAELQSRLDAIGDRAEDGGSIRGAVNKAVVTMRDWVSDLDADALPFIRDGEERLIGIYDDALEKSDGHGDLDSSRLLTTQRQQVREQKDRLPAS